MKETFKYIVEKIIVWEARLVLKKYKPGVVAITGSVGKTSAKDAIYTALVGTLPGGVLSVRKSDKSFNSDIGVALSVLGLPNGWYNPFRWLTNFIEGLLLVIFTFQYPRWLVLEIGADRPGDIERVTKWIKPDIVTLTRIPDVPVHVEFFPSVEALVSEKGQLVAALKPEGTLVVNADDDRIVALGNTIAGKKISYGFSPGASIRVSSEEIMYAPRERSDVAVPVGMRFRLEYGVGASLPVTVSGVLGHQHIYPVMAAFAVAIAVVEDIKRREHTETRFNPLKVAEALADYVPTPGRMRLIAGVHETTIIDDSYNASPVAVTAGLDALESVKVSGRKIIVLGDMLELGDYSSAEHCKIGEHIAAIDHKVSTQPVDTQQKIPNNVPVLFVAVGVRMRAAAESALDAGMDELAVLQFDTSREAGRYLVEELQPGDIIFVKGSQSMRMERVTEELMEHREQADKLLARQDAAWRKKA